MNWKFFLTIFVACFLTFLMSIGACFVGYKLFAPRIYSMDMSVIKKQYYKSEEAQKKLKSMVDGANAQIVQMRDLLTEKQTKVRSIAEKVKSARTAEEKKHINEVELAPALEDFRSQRELINKFSTEVQRKISQTARAEDFKITKEIKDEVGRMAKSIRAAYVIDRVSNGFAIENRDISTEIIRRLNNKKVEAPKSGGTQEKSNLPALQVPATDNHDNFAPKLPEIGGQ